MNGYTPLALGATLAMTASTALAEYAPPPDHSRPGDFDRPAMRDGEYVRAAPARSTIRLFTGPALRMGDGPARAGLFAAADIGAGAAGLRASGTWIGTGTDRGFSLYGAELWIDFGKEAELHPIVAAGAGLAHVDRQHGASEDLGVALLRATLQYRLPVDGVDARAGVDLSGNVRAFGPDDVTKAAWVTAAATVGVGF